MATLMSFSSMPVSDCAMAEIFSTRKRTEIDWAELSSQTRALPRLKRKRLDRAHALDGLDQQRLALALDLIESLQAPLERSDQRQDDEADERGEPEHHQVSLTL